MKKHILTFLLAILSAGAFLCVASKDLFEKVSNVRSKRFFLNKSRYVKGDILEFEASENLFENYESEDLYITSRDDKKMYGRLIKTDSQSDIYALCISGILNVSRDCCNKIARFYLENGVNVLITDQRGFGKSEGQYTSYGFLEAKDHMEWLKLLTEKAGESSKIIIHGVSMGAATTLMMCRNELPRNVKGIVADGAYTSLKQQLLYSFKREMMPANFAYFLYKQACFTASIFDPERTNPIDGAANINVPVLFVHGVKDKHVSYKMSEELYDICPSINKRLILVEEASHSESFLMSSEYSRILVRVIDKLRKMGK